MTYDAVTFDAGNTLVYLDHPRLTGILEEFGVRIKPEKLARAELETHADFDREDLVTTTADAPRFRAFVEGVLARAGLRGGPAFGRIHEAVLEANLRHRLWTRVPPKVPRLLDRLRRAGLRLGVVSNSDGRVEAFLKDAGLADRFDIIIDSRLVGVEKPDPRIFALALEPLGVPPHRALHVGDYYHIDVVGAERAGMTGVLLDPLGLHGAKPGRRPPCPVIRKLEELEAVLAGREPAPPPPRRAPRRGEDEEDLEFA